MVSEILLIHGSSYHCVGRLAISVMNGLLDNG